MSSSALIAAKKRFETSLKKFEIPTTTTQEPSCQSGVLLLSLLQSRLNWTSSVFPKYKADATQQPKRNNNSRKKWPNMIFLGVGCIELGPHMFEHTQFYKAKRTISEGEKEEELIDIVFELVEVPNERFIFPKEALISLSVENGPIEMHGSFLLPLDTTDEFELAKKRSHQDIVIQATTLAKKTQFQPTNIRITKVDQVAIDALEDYVMKKEDVVELMKIKMSTIEKTFIKYGLSEDPTNLTEVQDLLKRAMTVPDIATGPIMAEKKRNEILNAIQLGKRPRDEKFEAELPKNKYSNNGTKEDGLLKCAYCSTKHTTMWRPGPGGHGTLCNSCGIQWKRGEILKGAPVISLQEERKLIKERKEKERALEQLELQKLERESKKVHKIDTPTTMAAITSTSTTKKVNTTTASTSKKTKTTIPKPLSEEPSVEVKEQETTTSTDQQQQQSQANAAAAASFHLYSQGGIPLPTLSVDLGNSLIFSHPFCAVTLLDGCFHIRLLSETLEQTLIKLDKNDLNDAQFNIVTEGDPSLPREVLLVTLSPLSKPIQVFQKTIDQPITVRFLEKLDPNGGAVVKRIIQRWLVTIPQ